MDTTKKLGNIIKAKRVGARYNQEELADVMPYRGWYSKTISMLESAERNLTLEEAVYLAKVLGCSLEELAAPFIEEAQGWDPATASGPLVTTLIDSCGVVIYFGIATIFLTNL